MFIFVTIVDKFLYNVLNNIIISTTTFFKYIYMINKLIKIKDKKIIPKWFLRQAGRHIPEYHDIRNKNNNFIDFCFDKDSIVDATLLPLKYYDLDAAILFSDILILPHCLGQKVEFKKNIGPILEDLIISDQFFEKKVNLKSLDPIKKAINIIRKKIPIEKDLIGFCGAPWTLACYMIEGKSSKDFHKTRRFAWNDKELFQKVINKLTKECANLLEFQYKSGANVLMIFDTWSSMIPDYFWRKYGILPINRIVSNLRKKNINCPIIGLPFKSGERLIEYSYESLVDIVSIDWKTSLEWVFKNINPKIITQGNLDPALLSCDNLISIESEVRRILNLSKDKLHIFNVGHGLTPETKMENVQYVINLINEYKK